VLASDAGAVFVLYRDDTIEMGHLLAVSGSHRLVVMSENR
jgi:hypothetical protein